MDEHEDLVAGGQGRDADGVEWSAWVVCACVALAAAMLLCRGF